MRKVWDNILTKGEKKGFNAANRIHKASINACLLFSLYQVYAFLRDYNDFFLRARAVTNYDEIGEGPLNKNINETE